MTHAAHVGGRKNRLDVISSDGVRFVWTCIIIRHELLGIVLTTSRCRANERILRRAGSRICLIRLPTAIRRTWQLRISIREHCPVKSSLATLEKLPRLTIETYPMDFVSSRSNKLRYSRVQLTLVRSPPYLRVFPLVSNFSNIHQKWSASRKESNWILPYGILLNVHTYVHTYTCARIISFQPCRLPLSSRF